jgi:hypothetical protein
LKTANHSLLEYAISIGNKFANGVELSSGEFNAVEVKTFLLNHKIKIIEKRSGIKKYLGAAWYD